MTTLKHLSFAALAGLASGNFVSPGLKKCMTAVDDRDVLLTACTTDENQDFGVKADGTIMSLSKMCLQADGAEANSEVHLTDDCQGEFTHWELTQDGYVKLADTEQCLDVEAEEKADGTRETWDEIVLHDSVRIHLYDCHDACTSRVNQLWAWAAITGDDFGVADVQDSQLGPVVGNLVSPGLAKCLDIGGSGDEDVTGTHQNIQLVECSDGTNQNFRIVNGVIKVPELDKCLMAESAEANANVVLGNCQEEAADFKWSLTELGYIKLDNSNLCIDVQAQEKDDGSRENWEEIKMRPTANVILYDCHSVDTKRVNQYWEWNPIQPDSMGSRPGCDNTPIVVDPDVKPIVPQGSMPDDVDQADALLADDNDWIRKEPDLTLDNYAIGRVHMSSAAALASVASAAVLGAAAASAFAHRRHASVAESESLMVAEE